MARLINDLRKNIEDELAAASEFPPRAEYTFDDQKSFVHDDLKGPYLPVQKTIRRTVTCLQYSTFQAKEVIRKRIEKESTTVQHSCDLQAMVPKGNRYAYDLIAFVGRKSFLDGRKLTAINEELSEYKSSSNIPFSSLYDCQRKFLFYLGELHKQAAPRLKEYFRERGAGPWVIDGTLEAGSPVFFGIKEAKEGIFLGCWKIPTENDADITRCLIEAANDYGHPDRVLHDLSERMNTACNLALPGTPHSYCNYHFLSNLGKGLYKAQQADLSKRLRAMKLQLHLKDQRSRQTQRLHKAILEKPISLLLSDILNGKETSVGWSESLGREVLMGFHFWLLDYPNDGHRQGFPFDPYLLYFHRRIVTVHEASKGLLSSDTVRAKMPIAFLNFSQQLENYLLDPIIDSTATLYEKASNIFERVRGALRFFPKESNPMHDSYELSSNAQKEVKNALEILRKEFYEEDIGCDNPKEHRLYEIVLTHIDKYAPHLFASNELRTTDGILVRTTNTIETHWSSGKRMRRQTHGRKKLTRDFQALPAEFMLIPNLRNQRYVELVMGNLDNLADKLAEAGQTAGPYSHWYKKQQPLNIGRLSKRLLRDENFIEDLISISTTLN